MAPESGLGKDGRAIAALGATLAVAYGLDRLTTRLETAARDDLSLPPAVPLWATLGFQVLFAAVIVVFAWSVLRGTPLRTTTLAGFMGTGVLILMLATPAFRVVAANLPPDAVVRDLLIRAWHVLSPEMRLVEAGALSLALGVLGLFLRSGRARPSV